MPNAEPPLVDSAVALLFVPGDRADRYGKAHASGADLVILDLEDAVAPERKPAARQAAMRWLAGRPAAVRVNAVGTSWFDDDMAALRALPADAAVAGVLLPKADHDSAQVAAAQLPAGAPLLPLVESAGGLEQVADLARVPRVTRLVFGNLDFALDINAQVSPPDEFELLHARSRLVAVSRAYDLAPPVDGVTLVLDDAPVVQAAAERARSLGFGAKLCVHPGQVAPVHAAFQASAAELQFARRVLDAAATGSVTSVDGQMVDAPVVARARRLLARAAR